MAVTVGGTSITFNDGSTQDKASYFYRTRQFDSSRTYVKPADVVSLYVLAWGATGGQNTAAQKGGNGGAGYGELYIASPLSSYTVTIGAAGSTAGTAGGTTSFSTLSITGSGGVTTTTGSAGGVASGGDFNTSGGVGGNVHGGGGGTGSRAGNGFKGGNGLSNSAGGGGGTGGAGANGTSSVPGAGGIAATTVSASALNLPIGALFTTFSAGYNGDTSCSIYGGNGCYAYMIFDATNPGFFPTGQVPKPTTISNSPLSTTLGRGGAASGIPQNGAPGVIVLIEVCKV